MSHSHTHSRRPADINRTEDDKLLDDILNEFITKMFAPAPGTPLDEGSGRPPRTGSPLESLLDALLKGLPEQESSTVRFELDITSVEVEYLTRAVKFFAIAEHQIFNHSFADMQGKIDRQTMDLMVTPDEKKQDILIRKTDQSNQLLMLLSDSYAEQKETATRLSKKIKQWAQDRLETEPEPNED